MTEETVLACALVSRLPMCPAPSSRDTCADCNGDVWVAYSGRLAAGPHAKIVCTRCAMKRLAEDRRMGRRTEVRPLTPAQARDISRAVNLGDP